MPTIEVSFKDMCNLIGKAVTIEELKEEYILYAKGEVEGVDNDIIKIDIKDSNRPDLWSAEGVAREIKGRVVKGGCPRYDVKESGVVVKIDKKNKNVRPYTVCAVVKGLNIDETALSQIIQLQEKVCGTFGSNREQVAIGIYDFDSIKSPIRFTTVKPDGIKFVPLEFEKEMTPGEILENHQKGKEYGHLLAGLKEYPIFIDSEGEVLSMPPIINSNYSGKVTEETKNVFIECSGFNLKFLTPALNVVVAALADRGGKVESVYVVLPNKKMVTPDLSPKKSSVSIDYVNDVSGLNLKGSEMCKLLEMANYDAKLKGKNIQVMYPAYRQDIMHQRDIVEDLIISYGYNKIKPIMPEFKTKGKIDGREILSNDLADAMCGVGFQEILSYTLTSKSNLFEKMNMESVKVVEVENPVSENWSVFRSWIVPGLMEFLSYNQHVSYPQRIFEIGNIITIDKKAETRTRDVMKMAAAIADSKISYYDILAALDSLMSFLGKKYRLKPTKHKSFIAGRVASILLGRKEIGVIGEIHPSVLKNWKLEMPVAAFELNLEKI